MNSTYNMTELCYNVMYVDLSLPLSGEDDRIPLTSLTDDGDDPTPSELTRPSELRDDSLARGT